VALQILYRFDAAQHQPASPVEMASELAGHFEHFEVPAALREFASALVVNVLTDREAIDQLIATHSKNWKLERLSQIDHCLLRMAIGELQKFPETDAAIVIDEAIELAKQFGAKESPAFVNGLLDAVHQALRS